MEKSKNYKSAHKGIVFTLEAVFTLLLLIYISTIVNLNYTRKNNIEKFLFLQDVYEILEYKHSDFAFFAKSGIVNDNLKNLINEIEVISGRKFSIKNEKGIIIKDCKSSFSIERAIMTTDGPRKITLMYCEE
ncbi:MAG: hypothetical protein QXI58_02075 [Candidatus Micrarchaeia archaeon]